MHVRHELPAENEISFKPEVVKGLCLRLRWLVAFGCFKNKLRSIVQLNLHLTGATQSKKCFTA